jgi:hypothetical protein
MASSNAHKKELGKGGPLGKCEYLCMIAYPLNFRGSVPVSAIGFGAMGLSAFYGAPMADDDSRKVVKLVSIDSSSVVAPIDSYQYTNRQSNSDQTSLTRLM